MKLTIFGMKVLVVMIVVMGSWLNVSAQIVLQRCDVANLWEGSNTIGIDTNDKKEGIASIRFTGSGEEWFKKKFSQTNAGIDESGWFLFWLFVSDVSKFSEGGQIELSSSGGPDADEYSWNMADIALVNGWNEVKLKISDASIIGSPSLKSINYFRIYQFLSGSITAKLDFLRFAADATEPQASDLFEVDDVDFTTLDGKVMFGYQGWFQHPDEGSARGRWHHWGTLQDEKTIGVEMFPDMREYGPDEQYATGLTYADGRMARVFSSYNKKTVMRHMKWLRDYKLDGVFLQRFNTSLRDSKLKEVRDTVAMNVMAGCERYGRAFVNMWDLSGLGAGCADELIADWKHLVDKLKLTESPNYLHHRGKPLVAIWGFTVRNELPKDDLTKMIDFFKNSPEEKYRASIMLGTNHDFFQRTTWADQLKRVDVISPWAVGRYSNSGGHNSFINSMVKPGQDWCDKNNVDFLPVIWPGFSWYNLKREGEWQKNQIKRDGGNFYWTQSTRVVSANAKMVYIAMFDEVDEATAMFKVAENEEQSPNIGYWLPLNADGYQLPSDWYLRCAQLTTEVVKGTTPNRTSLGTPPMGLGDYQVKPTHTKCGTTKGKLSFNYPLVSADSLLEFSIDNGETYPYKTSAGTSSTDTDELPGGTYNVWMRRTDGSFPTDLGPYAILDVRPEASVMITDATCGSEDGMLTFVVGDNPYMGPLQISIEGADGYQLTTTDGLWTYSIKDLSHGTYSIWSRWADESCAVHLKDATIGTAPIPISLKPAANANPIVMDGLVIRACIGASLTITANSEEHAWKWSWSGPNAFSASSPNVLISDSVTAAVFGRYEVSYIDEQNNCNTKLVFFIRAETNCSSVGYDDVNAIAEMMIYPNPTDDVVHFDGGLHGIKSIRINNMLGRQLFYKDHLTRNSYSVDLSTHESGMYIYSVEYETGEKMFGKIMKK